MVIKNGSMFLFHYCKYGKAIYLEKARPNFTDITHQGDYVKIPRTNLGALRVPLKGNPILK
jgi:hypothetical protein